MRGLKRLLLLDMGVPFSRTLTSAWIETLRRSAVKWAMSGRTLTSAWIETFHHFRVAGIGDVALSRVRGLKRFRRPYP